MGAGITFRDSRIPIALVCADLPRGETVVLTSDSTPSCSLIDAVMATCAFPGIFPPVRLEDRLLVDGGLLNNVPADAVRQLGAEVVIAVDVNPTIPRQLTPEQYLEQRQLPRFIPAPAEALYQASMVMTAALVEMRLREAKPDLILRPELPEDITVFWGFHRAAEAITAGEEAAMRALPAIRQLLQ
jgi:NTE family protein